MASRHPRHWGNPTSLLDDIVGYLVIVSLYSNETDSIVCTRAELVLVDGTYSCVETVFACPSLPHSKTLKRALLLLKKTKH
eukprot:scaffold1665_cov270-Alexandrium_tamarense.AAC.27